jgi:hypothetical protein
MIDEQSQFKEMLDAVRELLPDSVVSTCEGLNGHGEWELALSHCLYYLEDVPLSDHAKELIFACSERFRPTTPGVAPNKSFKPKPLRGSA